MIFSGMEKFFVYKELPFFNNSVSVERHGVTLSEKLLASP
jgi:hypothetical protein